MVVWVGCGVHVHVPSLRSQLPASLTPEGAVMGTTLELGDDVKYQGATLQPQPGCVCRRLTPTARPTHRLQEAAAARPNHAADQAAGPTARTHPRGRRCGWRRWRRRWACTGRARRRRWCGSGAHLWQAGTACCRGRAREHITGACATRRHVWGQSGWTGQWPPWWQQWWAEWCERQSRVRQLGSDGVGQQQADSEARGDSATSNNWGALYDAQPPAVGELVTVLVA